MENMRNGTVLNRSRLEISFGDNIFLQMLVNGKIHEMMLGFEVVGRFRDNRLVDESRHINPLASASAASAEPASSSGRVTFVETAPSRRSVRRVSAKRTARRISP